MAIQTLCRHAQVCQGASNASKVLVVDRILGWG
jgi:hypothetical protein